MNKTISLFLVLIAALALIFLTASVRAFEGPDTSFECRPGEVYTTAECP